MIDLITTIALMVGSVALFLYWFRYSCLLILNADTASDYASALATSEDLHFLQVQAQLPDSGSGDLDKLHLALDHDYAVLQKLLDNADQESPLQSRMLALYYQASQSIFRLSRSLSPRIACQALEQMVSVVAHFANIAGEATAAA